MSSGPIAHVHLSNIVANWRALGGLNPSSETGAVVKADGYGHGAAVVSGALAHAGCQTFFTAHAHEGAVVRKAVGGDAVIYVLNGPSAEDVPLYASAALRPVINSMAQLQVWKAAGLDMPIALKFDTGMNRLGLSARDMTDAAAAAKGLNIAHIMSHLACADEPDHEKNTYQLNVFRRIAQHFPDTPASLSNSAGCYLGPDYAFHLTRPGIALYGGGPRGPLDLKPGLTLTAPVLAVNNGAPGETIGYGATYRLAGARKLATVALGYADGLPRSASNSGFGVSEGVRCPIIGRVSMDLTILDVTDAIAHMSPGVRIEFIGAEADLREQAALSGTIGYELLTGLGPRVERIYG